jgi:hypothetical protein
MSTLQVSPSTGTVKSKSPADPRNSGTGRDEQLVEMILEVWKDYARPAFGEFTKARPNASSLENAAAFALICRQAACFVLLGQLAARRCEVRQVPSAPGTRLTEVDGFEFLLGGDSAVADASANAQSKQTTEQTPWFGSGGSYI